MYYELPINSYNILHNVLRRFYPSLEFLMVDY